MFSPWRSNDNIIVSVQERNVVGTEYGLIVTDTFVMSDMPSTDSRPHNSVLLQQVQLQVLAHSCTAVCVLFMSYTQKCVGLMMACWGLNILQQYITHTLSGVGRSLRSCYMQYSNDGVEDSSGVRRTGNPVM
jgi:hypothetical protein